MPRAYRSTALLALLFAVQAAAFARWGALNEDEGWYLYAAGQISAGALPYRDFAFTQSPLLPALYAPLIGAGGGLAAGRHLSAALGLAGLGLAIDLARRLSPPSRRGAAGDLCGLAICASPFAIAWLAIPKTYALGGALLAGGFWAAVAGRPGLGGALLAAAAGARLSLLPALPGLWASLWLLGDRRALCRGISGGLGGLALIFGPLILAAPTQAAFGLLGYHLERSAPPRWRSAPVWLLGIGRDLLAAHALPLIGLALAARGAPGAPAASQRDPVQRAWLVGLGLAATGITAAHLSAPGPHVDYQVAALPLLAVLAGIAGAAMLERRGGAWLVGGILVVGAGLGRWPARLDLSQGPPLREVEEAARLIERAPPDAGCLFTPHAYLAVASRRALCPGLEMGPFSYFPDRDPSWAAARRVLDHGRAVALAGEAGAAALTERGLLYSADYAQASTARRQAQRTQIVEAIEQRLSPAAEREGFGQFRGRLQIWLPPGDAAR